MWLPANCNLLAYLVPLCLVPSYLAAIDYCSLNCGQVQHTMCQYKQGLPGSKCVMYNNATLTDGEKEDIVRIHNMIRKDVANGSAASSLGETQPPAADMMQLVWDDELAAEAQTWSDQCVFEHDSCRSVERFEVGQNIAMRTATTQFTAAEMYENIDKWFSEVDLLKPDILNTFVSSASDHYTQLVWSRTGAIGCGASIYHSGGVEYVQLLVCNYGPAGNVPGEHVYMQGKSCSACPKGTSCSAQYEGLCYSPGYAKMLHKPHSVDREGSDMERRHGASRSGCGGAMLLGRLCAAGCLLLAVSCACALNAAPTIPW